MTARAAVTWEGLTASELAHRCSVPRLELLSETTSTQDVAHELAARGASAGTTVLSDLQMAGRGRFGRTWNSPAGSGVWCTVIERLTAADAFNVLSLRVGLALADALDAFAPDDVRLKWPNDLMLTGGKLAGVLTEARWTGDAPQWVAIGVGVNVVAPKDVPKAAALRAGADRVAVLSAVVGAIRLAAASTAARLNDRELAAYQDRDFLRGRRIAEPAPGVVAGITSAGHLLVDTKAGREEHRDGSVVLTEVQ